MSRIVPDHLIKRKDENSTTIPRKTTSEQSNVSSKLDNTTTPDGSTMVDGHADKPRRSHSRKRSESMGDQLGLVQESEDFSGEQHDQVLSEPDSTSFP